MPEICNACDNRWPDPNNFIVELDASIAYLHDDQFFPGWIVLVLKHHATELFHLTPDERIQLMNDVSWAAHALQKTFNAVKINYALFGNVMPHIHWHLIPRLSGDPAPLDSVFSVKHAPLTLSTLEKEQRIALLQQTLLKSQKLF